MKLELDPSKFVSMGEYRRVKHTLENMEDQEKAKQIAIKHNYLKENKENE